MALCRLTQFCKQLSHCATHCTDILPVGFEDDVKSFQASLLSVIGIFGKYKRMFRRHVETEASSLRVSRFRKSEVHSPLQLLLGCGWLLYLTAKGKRLGCHRSAVS